jgi:hypothetical protein
MMSVRRIARFGMINKRKAGLLFNVLDIPVYLNKR